MLAQLFRIGPAPQMLTVLCSLALAACGGGGASDGESSGQAKVALTAANPVSAADGSGTAVILSQAREAAASQGLTLATNSATVGSSLPMGGSAMLYLQGIPDQPLLLPPLAAVSNARTFYVNSQLGDDTSNGLSAAADGSGAGPWRSLARLATSGMAAGDTVVLACNSVWRETLRLPVSGTAGRAITVQAPASGCATPPAIDGSMVLPSSAWTRHNGSVYKTTLASAPLQLFSAAQTMTEAHHPNRGYLASDPTSMYAALAADGNVVNAGGHQASTQLVRGADLALLVGTNLTGARVRLRTHAWLIDESVITSDSNNRMTLATPTSFPATAGWGYYLMGQLWMVDSAGEWYYDAATQQLYAMLVNNRTALAGIGVSTLNVGIDLSGRSNIVIDGLSVRRVGTGVNARQTANVTLRNSRIEETSSNGLDATVSSGVVIDANAFTRIGSNAVLCEDENRGLCTGMQVRGNVLREIGMAMSGEQVVSLPSAAHAAIRPGVQARVTKNTLINANHVGVRPGANSIVEDNFIYGACSVLDDCAAIYVWADQGITIRRNTIIRSRGALAGKPPTDLFTQAQGIYLDEATTNTLIESNTILDTDNGIQIHVSPNNTIRGNLLYGNRTSQLWLQENSRALNPNGDLFGLQVQNNQFAAVYPGSVAMRLDTSFATTAGFGSFDGNRYYDRASAAQIFLRTMAGSTTMTVAQWRNSQGVGSTQPVDANGSGVGDGGYAEFNVGGVNAVPNANLSLGTLGLAGWTSWNATSPSGQLTTDTCTPGRCLRYRAGGSAGMISSPNFPIVAGTWYKLTVDLSAELSSQWLQIVVRRNGGVGSAAYELLGNRYLVVTAGQEWGRYSIIFQATKSAVPQGLVDGARIDIEGTAPGRMLSVANLELVPLSRTSVAEVSSAYVNVSGNTATTSCPVPVTGAGLCNKLADLSNNLSVNWPLPLPSVGGVLLYGQDADLSDSDLDGIPNSQDLCANTAIGAVVNANGCSLTQR